MGHILAISSQVARGHIGLGAIVPALQHLGHEAISLPTILLSNHPGHPHAAGARIEPETLSEMLGALESNGWLGEIEAVITGYMPSAAHAAFAVEAIERVLGANDDALVFVDPILGDDPKGLYVDRAAAEAIRDLLLPLADIATPNRFELAWLSEHAVEDWASAAAAAQSLAVPIVVATSIPEGPHGLLTLAIDGEDVVGCTVRRLARAPHGTGDLLTALLAGHALRNVALPEAMARATAGVQAVLARSSGRDELDLVSEPDDWSDAAPLPLSARA